MSPKQFNEWLMEMKITSAEAARILGVHPNTVTRFKRDGAPLSIALACRALYHRLEPWT